MECHKCKYNGMRNEACLSCALEETYRYPNQKYIFEGYDIPDEKSIIPLEEIKPLIDEEYEDVFRKGLCDLFSLSIQEILMVWAIMNGLSLIEFCNEIEKLSEKNKKCSRFKAFQIRKSILKKLPDFSNAFLTKGQRKKLKIN